ncbi:RNA-directed DNA polymerase, eukaryota, reverse transcriptase zinc-binding domain protein [Tanacetum coccineum]
MVKDFRPISLIGSLYKIIAKILANRLVTVLGNIVNDMQSAFIKDRKILDGPFILNEIFQWCKLKKKHSFILKIDFEKAYDSVHWDYLDDVLRKFGFGEKWCGWIQECLRSSWGLVLVNGSPTEEFQFFKGLKQGDPLSPFLFILVMESLHLSFKRVVDAGMFNGIVLDPSIQLSYMFYVDDAVFMAQWSDKNIDTIIYVLKCFQRASGLHINLTKRKLMGLAVSEDRVEQASTRIGCGVFKAPFVYLGSIVGGSMSRIKSWEEIVGKMAARLSKWKMKTLSIGYGKIGSGSKNGHNSIWRVIVQEMEALRRKIPEVICVGVKQDDRCVVLSVASDRWYWSLDGSGEFTIASVRKVIDDIRLPVVATQTRWIKAVPIKVNVHAWKVSLNYLPTRLNLSRIGMDIPSILCPICDRVTESSRHLFFECHFAKDIFRKICRWWNVDFLDVNSFDEWTSWIDNLRMPSKHKRLSEVVVTVRSEVSPVGGSEGRMHIAAGQGVADDGGW